MSVKLEELEKGSLILVKWYDANEARATLENHEQPDVYVKDWGIYLGTTGVKKRYIIIGKDVVELRNEWGATRIPVELISSITLIVKRSNLMEAIPEIQVLTRKITLRRYRPRRYRIGSLNRKDLR